MTLEYWNTLADQTILISSLLSVFSITIVASLMVSDRNDKLSNRIFKTSILSAACFLVTVFAMVQIYMITTPGGLLKEVNIGDFIVPRIIGLTTFMIGIFSTTVVIALSGWTKSRKLGLFTTSIGIITLLLILSTLINVSS